MRILVAGGAGYIGSNMTAMLAAEGHQPVIYDNLSKGHTAAIKECEFVKGDLADFNLLTATLKKHKIETVMHFAAFIEAGESVINPLKYYQNNVSNTQVVLSAMESAASGNLYSAAPPRFTECPTNSPLRKICRRTQSTHTAKQNWPPKKCVTIRPSRGQTALCCTAILQRLRRGNNCTLGEDHKPESHLIPLTIFAAMGKMDAIKIFGSDYPTDDGTCVRDYIHIEDLCLAHLLALKKLDKQPESIYNLG